MTLETSSDVGEIQAVRDRDGGVRPPANADEQQNIAEAVSNADTAFADKANPPTDGAAALPSYEVADGASVLILADPANSAQVCIGPEGSVSFPLPKGKGLTFEITDTATIHAHARQAGDTVHLIGEGS